MIRAVFDANVLASGFVGLHRPESTPGELLRSWHARAFELVVSEHLRTEVLNTLRDRYFRRRLSPPQLSRAAALLRYRATQTPMTTTVHGIATHPEDDLVLATAVSAKVEYLVTGDSKLQGLGSYEGVRLVSPVEFLAILQAEREAGLAMTEREQPQTESWNVDDW
jgi:uncharacterized protein